MKFLLKLFFLVSIITSCNSQKPIIKKSIEDYKKEGYILGVIEFKDITDCRWVITVDKSKLQYDPINIENKKFSHFTSSKKTSIFFKFFPLRMKNRCDGIVPIQLIEVIKS
ncbi:MAG: hypothetical protein GKR88_16605 [Flavobacteriaceae bacterium]|nr:MAG: hypothetical protein GKR88_16605 [Flavobacteriaceae bacterium]